MDKIVVVLSGDHPQQQQRQGKRKYELYERNSDRSKRNETSASPSGVEKGESSGRRDQPGRDRMMRLDYDASKSIYVSRMKGSIKRDTVRELFEQFGKVRNSLNVSPPRALPSLSTPRLNLNRHLSLVLTNFALGNLIAFECGASSPSDHRF